MPPRNFSVRTGDSWDRNEPKPAEARFPPIRRPDLRNPLTSKSRVSSAANRRHT